MKSILRIFICLFLSGLVIHCSNSEKSYGKNNDVDSTFTKFLNKIDTFKLPFKIDMNSDSIAAYVETVYGNGQYKPNEKFNIIQKNECKFLKDKYPIDSIYLYKALFKNRVGNNYVVLITQNNLYSFDFFWFKLNSYSSSGNLIDTLTVAGSLPFGIDLSCGIDSLFIIKTTADITIPNPTEATDTIPALLVYSSYKLNNEGYFKKTKFEKMYGHYYLLENSKYEFRK